MTTSTSTAAPAKPPLRLPLTILHLAVYGIAGWATIGLFIGLLGASIGLVFVLGLGLVLMVGLIYWLFGIAWLETERVSGLYGLDAAPLRWVRRRDPGFGGYIRSLGAQLASGRMWAAVANFVLTSLFGAFLLWCFQYAVWGVAVMFAPLTGAESVVMPYGFQLDASYGPLMGLVSLVLIAAMVGLAFLHRAVSCSIIGATARESELTDLAHASAAQREGAVRAADVERTRIERDLHDGVQPRLVSVGMTLGLARQQIDSNPDQAKALVDEAHTSTKAAITELRQLARGIYASVLDDRGLDAALSALAARSHIPVHLDVRVDGRCSRDAEAAVYFAIAESLTNAAKHSRASECRVVVRVRDGEAGPESRTLWARVEDNGIGGARVTPGGGLDGITNRVLAAGGTCNLDSPQGGPTSLEVSVPCAS